MISVMPSRLQMNFSLRINGAKITEIIIVKHDVDETISMPPNLIAKILNTIENKSIYMVQ